MRTSDKIFLLPVIVFSLNLLYRLVDASKLITTFPLDYVNDLASYLAMVHFFDVYGFLQEVPNWFNGFILFNTYPPGWAVYTYFFYKVFGNLLLATYISTISLYILGFIAVYLIGKELRISLVKRLALFLFVFANPMLIGAVLKQGRLPSFMALVIFTYLVYIALYFKERQVNWKIVFLGLIFVLLILTHQPETVLSGVFLLGIFLVKKWKERIVIATVLFCSVLVSSFWLIPFLYYTFTLNFLNIGFANWLLNFKGYFWNNLIGIILSASFFVLFYLYYRQRPTRTTLLFFAPVLVLNFLYLTRLIVFVPILKFIYPDPFNDFLMFFVALFLVSIRYRELRRFIKISIACALILFSIMGIWYNMTQTPFFVEHSEEDEHFIELIQKVEGKYIFMATELPDSYPSAYAAYAAIYYNKSTIHGWGEMFKEYEYTHRLEEYLVAYFEKHNCQPLLPLLAEYNATEILTHKEDCSYFIEECGLIEKARSGDACLLKIP